MTLRRRRPPAGRRLAAGAALVCLGGAITAIVVGTAANWKSVVVAIAAVLIAVAAGWYAVSRRGVVRRVAAAVTFAGVGLLFVAAIAIDLHWVRVAVALLLAGSSVGLAQRALQRSPRTIRGEARRTAPWVPARRGALIINPRSGGAKAGRYRLVEACRARGIEPIVLQPGDDLLHVAEEAIVRGADVIGMAGGDGSQALVATAAIRHGVPHVVVPSGTRNHLALDLGVDRDDLVGALDAYSDGVERQIDVATVNGLLFLNNASVGIYARIVQSPAYRHAKRQTVLDVLPELVGPDAEPVDVRFVGPDGAPHSSAEIILVSNNPYQLHMMAGRGTRERLDRGVLGIAVARVASASEFTRFLALETTGRGGRFPGLLEWTASEFRIDSSAPVEVGIDGEARVLEPPLIFKSSPAALRVRLPRRALGRSPAAVAAHVLSRSTITQLARVATGHRAEDPGGGRADEHGDQR